MNRSDTHENEVHHDIKEETIWFDQVNKCVIVHENIFDKIILQVSEENYSFCWPQDWLAEDSNHVCVIGCDFDSYISQWGGSCPTQNFKQSLSERSEDMLAKLQQAGAGRRQVIFVGHSMGRLIIKKMLCMAQDSDNDELKQLANNTKRVVFYFVIVPVSPLLAITGVVAKKYLILFFLSSFKVKLKIKCLKALWSKL